MFAAQKAVGRLTWTWEVALQELILIHEDTSPRLAEIAVTI